MKRVFRSPAAEQDLIDIWCSIALDSPSAADRMIDRLTARIGQLSAFPESGPRRPDIGEDARILVEGNWLILYRIVAGSEVEIVRVMHGARDLSDMP